MKKIRILTVRFDKEIASYEIPAFRGAVIGKVGRDAAHFHNHSEDGGFIKRYPPIQYKRMHGKPGFFCLGEGVDEIHRFFNTRDWSVEVSNRKLDLQIEKLDLQSITLQVWNRQFEYRIFSWIALNPENHKKYQSAAAKEKIDIMEQVLIGNVLSMAKGIGWLVDKPVSVTIQSIDKAKVIKYKGVPMVAFDVTFNSNVYLPNYMGLGKGASHGFGSVVHHSRKEN